MRRMASSNSAFGLCRQLPGHLSPARCESHAVMHLRGVYTFRQMDVEEHGKAPYKVMGRFLPTSQYTPEFATSQDADCDNEPHQQWSRSRRARRKPARPRQSRIEGRRAAGDQHYTMPRRRPVSAGESSIATCTIRIAHGQFKGGHPGTVMGAAAIGVALWRYHMRYNPLNPDWAGRDRTWGTVGCRALRADG